MPIPILQENRPIYADPQVGLDKALGMFKETVQQAGLTRALMQADEQVKSIQSGALKEQEKMTAMNDIARSLTFNMLRSGATAGQIEQAAGTVKAKPIQTADEAILRGTLSGDEGLVQKGLRADYLSAANKLAVLERTEAAKAKPALKQADMDFESNVAAGLRNLDALQQTVKRTGNIESTSVLSPLSNPKEGAKLSSLYYDTAIAYAKIVDPTSVAREGEVESAKKYAIPTGVLTSNKATLQAIADMRKGIMSRLKDRRALRAQGKLDPQDEAAMEAAAPGAKKSYFTPVK